jgi:hypothetical protein
MTNSGAGNSAGYIHRKSRGIYAAISVYGYSTQPAVQNGPPFGGVRIARMNETLVATAVTARR